MVSDRYHLRQSIGSGGMSEVYEADDSVLGRTVAVKMLRPDMARDVNFRERFRREALTARNLTQKLDLLGREKYLIDLGIKKRFSDMLRRELEVLVREEGPNPGSLSALSEAIARKHGAPSELVLRALERLGVTERAPSRRPPPDSTS